MRSRMLPPARASLRSTSSTCRSRTSLNLPSTAPFSRRAHARPGASLRVSKRRPVPESNTLPGTGSDDERRDRPGRRRSLRRGPRPTGPTRRPGTSAGRRSRGPRQRRSSCRRRSRAIAAERAAWRRNHHAAGSRSAAATAATIDHRRLGTHAPNSRSPAPVLVQGPAVATRARAAPATATHEPGERPGRAPAAS